jgi:hypothetical protein
MEAEATRIHWLRALMERYEDFRNVTEAALRSAVSQLKIQASEARLDSLMQAYLFPRYPQT